MATKNSSLGIHSGFIVLFGLAFLAPGLFTAWLFFGGFAKWWDARQWVEVPCWIESAELRVSHGKSSSYQATADYRYIYQDRTYHGSRVGFSTGSDNIGSFQQNAHRELMQHTEPKQTGAERDATRSGTKPFRCYVNPSQPAEAVLYRDLRWEMQAFMAIFALTFPAVGAGVVFGGLAGIRQGRIKKHLVASHPAEPWLWKPAWTTGPIPESSSGVRTALAAYTAWAGMIVFSLLGGTWLSGAFQREQTPWVLLIFLALWCIPAWFCWQRIRNRLAVGTAKFELKQLPVSPGGMLAGDIMLGKPAPQLAGGTVELRCERKTFTRTGNKSATVTTPVWSHREPLAPERINRDVFGCRIPVQFAIPGDAPPCGSDDEDSDREIIWTLQLKVPATGIDATFEVPVFHHGNSAANAVPGTTVPLSIHSDAAANLPMMLERYGIVTDFDERGLLRRLYCPAARQRALIAFLLVFVLIWTGAAIALFEVHAPLVFKIAFPASAAVIWLAVIWQALHRRTVTFDESGLRVLNQLGPIAWRAAFDRNQVIGFEFGSNMTSNNTQFYRVRLENVYGKKLTLADGITDSTTAKTLVERLETWRKSG